MADPYYPDSNLSIRNKYLNLINDSVHKKLRPSQSGLQSGHYCAEDIFNENKDKKVMFFIFDADTIESTPWNQVVANNLYIKRYDFSYSDMDSMGWEVNYP